MNNYLDKEEIARRASRSARTIIAWIKSGFIPPHERLGDSDEMLWSEETVNDIIARHLIIHNRNFGNTK